MLDSLISRWTLPRSWRISAPVRCTWYIEVFDCCTLLYPGSVSFLVDDLILQTWGTQLKDDIQENQPVTLNIHGHSIEGRNVYDILTNWHSHQVEEFCPLVCRWCNFRAPFFRINHLVFPRSPIRYKWKEPIRKWCLKLLFHRRASSIHSRFEATKWI